MHSFNNHFLSPHHMLGTRDTRMKKKRHNPCSHGAWSLVAETDRNQIIKNKCETTMVTFIKKECYMAFGKHIM